MMKNNYKVCVAVLSLGLTALCASGCLVAAAGVGAGAVAYVRGELKTSLPLGLDAAHAKATKAVDRLEFQPGLVRKDALTGIVEARTAQDQEVKIVLTRQTDVLTEVSIRVGVFGNQTVSQAILDEMKK